MANTKKILKRIVWITVGLIGFLVVAEIALSPF